MQINYANPELCTCDTFLEYIWNLLAWKTQLVKALEPPESRHGRYLLDSGPDCRKTRWVLIGRFRASSQIGVWFMNVPFPSRRRPLPAYLAQECGSPYTDAFPCFIFSLIFTACASSLEVLSSMLWAPLILSLFSLICPHVNIRVNRCYLNIHGSYTVHVQILLPTHTLDLRTQPIHINTSGLSKPRARSHPKPCQKHIDLLHRDFQIPHDQNHNSQCIKQLDEFPHYQIQKMV